MAIDLERYRPMLRTLDDHVFRALSRVSLVAEADIPWQATLTALKIHVLAREGRQRQVARRFHEDYRYGLSAGIVAIARDRYQKGTLWQYVNEQLHEAGLPRDLDQLTQADFREVFIETLRELSLPTVGEGYSLVHTAAMHAGIPTYCLDDWFNLTRRGRRRVGDDPSELTRWATQSQDLAVMNDIDQPIKRMVVAGPEFAEDLFERAAELMDVLARDYSVSELGQIGSQEISSFSDHPALHLAEEIRLAPRWVVMAARNLSSVPARHDTEGRAPTGRAVTPTVRLNFIDGEVELHLPEILGLDAEVAWRVRIADAIVSEVAELDTTGEVIASKPITVPVRRPTRVLYMTFGEKEWQLPLWPEELPAVFFGSSGQQRSTSAGVIPPGPTWVLTPNDSQILLGSGPAIPTAADDPPIGWGDWSLARFDLHPADVVTIVRGESSSSVRVRGGESPQFLPPDPVPGAWSFGLPILADRPRIRFPAGTGPWRVSVSLRASDRAAWTRVVEDAQEVRLLDGEFAQVGTFDVVVRGPLGRGFKETFALADGLRIDCSPLHRRIMADGRLEATDIRAQAAMGLLLWPTAVHLTSDAGSTGITAEGAGTGQFGIRYFPPTTMVGLEDSNGLIRWGPRPVRVDASDIDSTPNLYLRLPGRPRDTSLQIWAGRQPVQTLEAKPALGASRFALTALKDTLAAHGDLYARLEDGQPIAWIGSKPRAASMTINEAGDSLVLGGVADASSLEVWAWLAGAGWRGPTLLEPNELGVVELPEHLRNGGPLLVHERVPDPWVELPPPDPVTARKRHVAGLGEPGWTQSERRLIRVAKGEDVAISEDDAETALAMLTGPGRDLTSLHSEGEPRIREACGAISNAMVALLNERDLQKSELTVALIRTGAYATRPTISEEFAARLWQHTPVLGALYATRTLALAIPSDTSEAAEENTEGRLRVARAEFGDSYLAMLATGADPYEREGYFDAGAIALESSPSPIQDAIVARMGLVPKALLDRDSRAVRVADLIQQARGGTLGNLPDLAAQVLALDEAFRTSPFAFTWAAVKALQPAQDWGKHRWIPPFVRAAALVARAHARGGPLAPRIPLLVHLALASLAVKAPSLVTAELVRAEAILSAQHRPPTPALPSNRPAGAGPVQPTMKES